MAYVQPSRADVHVNVPLTNISLAFMQDQMGFVADRVFQNVPVPHESNVFYSYPRGDLNRNRMERRAPATESAGGTHRLERKQYLCEKWGFHEDVTDDVRANADRPMIDPDRDATEYVTMAALISKEYQWVQKYLQAGRWSHQFTADADSGDRPAGASVLTAWSTSGGDPIQNIRTMKRTVGESTGFRPNVLVLGREAYDVLLDHDDVVDRIKAGQTPGGPAMTMRETLAALFELDEILVMDAIYNDAKQGADDAHKYIGDSANGLLFYRPARPGLRVPAAGYTFSWTGYLGATMNGARIKRFRMEHIQSDRVEIEMYYDHNQISADLGVFIHQITG